MKVKSVSKILKSAPREIKGVGREIDKKCGQRKLKSLSWSWKALAERDKESPTKAKNKHQDQNNTGIET